MTSFTALTALTAFATLAAFTTFVATWIDDQSISHGALASQRWMSFFVRRSR
jgi:hypothetical protein